MTPIISTIISTISNALSPATPAVNDAASSFGQALSNAMKPNTTNADATNNAEAQPTKDLATLTNSNSSSDIALNSSTPTTNTVIAGDASTTISTPLTTNANQSGQEDSASSSDQNNMVNAQIVLSMLNQQQNTPSFQAPSTSSENNKSASTTALDYLPQTVLKPQYQLINQLSKNVVPQNNGLATKAPSTDPLNTSTQVVTKDLSKVTDQNPVLGAQIMSMMNQNPSVQAMSSKGSQVEDSSTDLT